MNLPTIDDIRDAAKRIEPYVHRTPVLTCSALNRMCGADLYFKCENFQKVGAFKIRGATNTAFLLTDEEASKGLATHSSGNHAAAVALAAKWRGTRAFVVMPESSPDIKKNAVAGYGAEIVFCKPTLEAREESLAEVVKRTGAAFIHPYNDFRVVSGQGTVALELLGDVPGLDIVIGPVGGGGMISGTAITVASLSPRTEVIAAEPAGADDAYRSLKAGRIIPSKNPDTIADGLLTSLGDLTFAAIRKHVKEIITVSDEGIMQAMRHIWERMKIIVEPSAAVPLAAILGRRERFKEKRIGIILTGGNVELTKLPWR